MDERLEADAERLELAVRVYSKKPPSLASAINTWCSVAREIPDYPYGVFEYVHSVSARDDIHRYGREALRLGLSGFLEVLAEEVDPLDEQYRENTIPDVERLTWGVFRSVPDYWWKRRLPRNERLLVGFRGVDPAMYESQQESWIPNYLFDQPRS